MAVECAALSRPTDTRLTVCQACNVRTMNASVRGLPQSQRSRPRYYTTADWLLLPLCGFDMMSVHDVRLLATQRPIATVRTHARTACQLTTEVSKGFSVACFRTQWHQLQ